MRMAFIIGSPLRYSAYGRTGVGLIHEAHLRGHRLWLVEPDSVSEREGRVVALAHEAAFPPTADVGTFWRRIQLRVAARPPAAVDLGEEADALIWRKDPPLARPAARLLARLPASIPCLNDPRGLLRWASKARALERFGPLMPPSALVTTCRELDEAARAIPGALVVKPLEEGGGRGVIRLGPAGRPSLARRVAAEPLLARSLASGEGLLVQQEVRGRGAGDVRLVWLDGRLLGAFRRIPRGREFRANVSLGSRIVPVRLSSAALRRWEAVAGELAEEGLPLVGLDVVDDWLIEVNVVSPGGLPRLNALLGLRLEREVLEWLERRCGAAPAKGALRSAASVPA